MPNQYEIFQYLSGSSDAGSAINFTVETTDSSLGMNFETLIMPVEISFNVKVGSNIGVFIGLDGATPIQIGTAKKGLNRIDVDISPRDENFARCRSLKISFREFSKSKAVIANVAVKFYATEEVESWRA